MERIFLIGGSGFIGKNFVDIFDSKYEIHVIDKFIDEEFFRVHPSVKTLKMDLVDDVIPDDYVSPDYIINLASIINTSDDITIFDQLISSNLKVLINLYTRYKDDKNLKLFVQFGSSEEYGNIEVPFKESVREEPTTPYALVKQLTVNTALMLHRNFGFPAMAVRPGNLFGRFQNPQRFIPYVILQMAKNKPLDVSMCEQKRDFLYGDDFVACVEDLLCNYENAVGEIVNISTGKSVSLRELIEICKDLIGSTSVINFGAVPYKAKEIMDLNCSIEKFQSISGKVFNFDLASAMEKCVIYYTRENYD